MTAPTDPDEFAGYLITQGMSDNTVRNYRALFVRWVSFAREHDADPFTFTPTVLRAWTNEIKNSRSMKGQAQAMAVRLGEIHDWPADDVRGCIQLPRKPKPKSRALSDEALRTLVAASEEVGGRPRLALMIGLYTAARRGEIAGMKWEWVDWDRDAISFWRPKTSDVHTVPMHPHLRELLHEWRLGDDLWLFPGRYGGHVSPATIGTYIDKISTRSGVACTPHVLRHTAITLVHDATPDLRAAQEFAGHRSPTITAHYTRLNEYRLREAVSLLDFRTPVDK